MVDTRKATSFKEGADFVYRGFVVFTCRQCYSRWSAKNADVMEDSELRDAGFPPRLLGTWRFLAL